MSRYGVNKDTREGGSTRMRGGINNDASLTEALFASPKNDGTGDPVIILNFQGPTGTFKHIEWSVNEQNVRQFAQNKWQEAEANGKLPVKRDKKPYSGVDEYEEAEIDRAYDTFNSRMKHIAKAFESNEDLIVFEGESYADVAQKFVSFLNERKGRNKVNLLLTLDKKLENLSFPAFPKFIEPAGTNPTTLVVGKYIRTGETSAPDSEQSTAEAMGEKEEEPEF